MNLDPTGAQLKSLDVKWSRSWRKFRLEGTRHRREAVDSAVRSNSAGNWRILEVEAEYGPTGATITCIGVDSLSNENNGAMWVTSGGIGYNFIRLKFRSKYSRGLHYRVYVYGKPH
ncbi:PREDICTED: uncharacterized protein LOC107188817 [Dufourea novaeangliae]|uniref:uncharacterized protein LOC107188817 n=1 Tax=Dufourea novaeangliae TaxID=178035 RepID=UPI000767C03C|nr:PREDICTED: uncharacterized protein LOC107188817 [Dufourea novaeangliae]